MPPIHLPRDPSPLAASLARLKRVRGARDCWKWSFVSMRLAGLPLRIRPAFVLYTLLTLILLSLLGFHPTLAQHLAPPDVPFSDKVLHFVCFLAATVLFFQIWVVEEQARRVWYWAWFNELVSVGVCVLAGGILSELVQSLLPYKTFQPGDVLANLLGSSLGVVLSSRLASRQRRERELRRLYEQLGGLSDDEEEDEEAQVQGEGLLSSARAEREMEEGRRGVQRAQSGLSTGGSGSGGAQGGRRGSADPWNAAMGEDEIFGLGGEDDEDEEEHDAAGKKSDVRGPL
ncbi:hypothetical protein JCM8097_004213 [Rhodosporidiobolus ruineniae]